MQSISLREPGSGLCHFHGEKKRFVKGGVKLDHWGGGKVDQYTG